jgi:hypothetical protein
MIQISNIISITDILNVLLVMILVGVTWYYAYQTRRIRIETVKPHFAFEPGLFNTSGDFLCLYLINTGGVARELEAVPDGEETGIFVPSLARGEKVEIISFQRVEQLKQSGSILILSLRYSDGYGEKHQEILSLNFGKIKNHGVPYKFNTLEMMQGNLRQIENRLGDIVRKSRS